MKRIFAGLLLLVAVTASFGAAGIRGVTAGDQKAEMPADIWVIALHDADYTDAADTFAAADTSNIYGPYKLSQSGTEPMFKYMRVFFQGGLASGDSVEMSYQIIDGTSLSDTVTSAWVVLDTFTSGGKILAYTDISDEPGRSIVFRITNIDSTASHIGDWVRVLFKRAMVWAADKR